MGESFMKAYRAYHELTRWALYQDNPEYVKETIHYEYWHSKEEQEEFGLKVLLIVSGITVLLSVVTLIILFKCRIGEKDKEEPKEELEALNAE